MSDQKLMKMARMKDDGDFAWRVAAAITLRAQAQADADLTPASRALTNWVLEHPMERLPRMIAFVSTDPAVVEAVTITDGALTTADVPDAAIEKVVGERWDVVAKLEYPQA